MRQVGGKLVIRLEKELLDRQLALLNRDFADLVASGRIRKTAALKEEEDEPDMVSKPRIAFINSHRSTGRLNQFILMLNEMGKE